MKEKTTEKKSHKFLIFVTFLIIAAIALFVLCAVISGTGDSQGGFVGYVKGSIEGAAAGKEAGKNEGLSAEDTEVEIIDKIHSMSETGKLEVLSASVVVHNKMTMGDDYKNFTISYGNIIFTVDLNEADIDADGKSVNITIPKPESQLTINYNDERNDIVYEDLKHFFSGDAASAYEAGLNSDKKILEKANEDQISNYSMLERTAEEYAVDQVTNLIKSGTLEEVSVNVGFKEGEGSTEGSTSGE